MRNPRIMAAVFKTILEWGPRLDPLEPTTLLQIKTFPLI